MEKEKSQHKFGIKKQFINRATYQKISERSKRGIIIYDSFCESLQSYHRNYQLLYDRLYESIKVSSHDKNPFVKEFKQFLTDFTSVLKQIANFQVDCLTQIRSFKSNELQNVTDSILGKIEDIKQLQYDFQSKQKLYTSLLEQVKIEQTHISRDQKEPMMFYNQKHIEARKKAMSGNLKQLQDLNKELITQVETVTDNSKDFQRYLNTYRKRLFSNKYQYLTKLWNMSKSSRESLTQLLVLLFQSVNNRYTKFTNLVKEGPTLMQYKLKRSGKGSEQQESISSQIINSTQQYNIMVEEIGEIIKIMVESLGDMAKRGQQIYQKSKTIFLESLNKVYEIQENPSASIMDSLDLFNYFTQKFSQASDKLFVCSEELTKLRQNVKKHSDITLSLLKCGPYKSKVLQPQTLNTDSPRQYNGLQNLMQQMSIDFINAILQKVYKIYLEILNQLKNYFNTKYYKKKKNYVQDSMEISHIEQEIQVFHRKPAKHEVWLWSDWKDYSFEIQYPQHLIEEIVSKLQKIAFLQNPGRQIDKFNCVLSTKKDCKGILKIFQKEVQFSSSDGSTTLRIPFDHIQQIEAKVRIFEKIILLTTAAGEVTLGKFMHDTKEVQEALETQLELAQQESGGVKVKKRMASVLSPAEEQLMSERKLKISPCLQPIGQLIKIDQAIIQGTTIDHVYEMAFSDKNVTIKGKQSPCLYTHIMAKAKNVNLSSTKFQPPGPKFYTGNESVTFENGPFSSQRVVQYDHPIPPIPFMPKYCHCKQTITIFWISHEEFDVLAEARQSGAPYTEYLYCKILNKVKKQLNGNVKIQVFANLIFTQDFSMRRVIQGKARSEMQLNCKYTLQEQRKYIVSMTSNTNTIQNKEKDLLTADTENSLENKPNSEVDKLKLQNKLLIAGFALLIILNIFFSTFFGDD